MNAKERLTELDETQAVELLKMAKLGYRYSRPTKPVADGKSAYAVLMKNVIGCEDAKAKIQEVIASVRLNNILRARGKPVPPAHYHMVFMGPPGSAKTTMAHTYAKILYEEGVIKNRKLVVLSRSNLVGRYQGETARLVRETFESNRGACILVDEAYSLDDADDHNLTFGREAIDEIILELEEATETVVIFAGYTDKMQSFLDANPGLRSRIPITVCFKDYTTEELFAICNKMAQDRGYSISDGATDRLNNILDAARLEPNFGNGRYCRNLVEKAIAKNSLRIGIMDDDFDYARYIDAGSITDEELFTLKAECFQETEAQKQNEPKRKIGF